MKLEILQRTPVADSGRRPLLFVHGVCHGAWCWEHWMEWFGSCGRPSVAVSLRGHAGSEGRSLLHEFGLVDYRNDVLETAAQMGQRPVLVGHSMGGAVAQLALAADPGLFSGVVLLASLPPDSVRLTEALPMFFRVRAMRAVKKLMAGEALQPEEVRQLIFFDNRISHADAARFAKLLQPESRRAVGELKSFRASKVEDRPPMLVLGSARDSLFGRSALRRTARHYGADLAILDDGCHDIMVDPLRYRFAARLDTWLTEMLL